MADDEDVWVDSIEAYSKKIEIQKAPEPSERKSFREKTSFFVPEFSNSIFRTFRIRIPERKKRTRAKMGKGSKRRRGEAHVFRSKESNPRRFWGCKKG